MEITPSLQRVLAFTLATEITPEELEQISGGTQSLGTNYRTHLTTMGGQDHNYDSNSD